MFLRICNGPPRRQLLRMSDNPRGVDTTSDLHTVCGLRMFNNAHPLKLVRGLKLSIIQSRGVVASIPSPGSNLVIEGSAGISRGASVNSSVALMTGEAPRAPFTQSEDSTRTSLATGDCSAVMDGGVVMASSKSVIPSSSDLSN